ncbi:MAG TPA: hypothetical protein VJY63_03970 [Marinospirillum sp.]|uniref:hypothetical protein n=1 Tax=Marinospirillum sp. TaxID=2183934 RepID=UPI002B4A0DE9|nr:hypothetical protein [Marinospirillum sp.]HKM15069.1 hypothetical protein [Marinospirillum sp.]
MSSSDKKKKLIKAKKNELKAKKALLAAKKSKLAKNKKRPLIDRVKKAVKKNELPTVFTAKNLKSWMKDNKIVKNSGKEYKKSVIKDMLSNSDKKNDSSNANAKTVLHVRTGEKGKKEYCFSKNFK